MTTITSSRTSASTEHRTGGPIDPSPYSVATTLSGALLAIVLAVQATDALGAGLAWAAIVGHFALGMTMMLSARYQGRAAGMLKHAWLIGVIVVGICEFLAMMVVWGGLHL